KHPAKGPGRVKHGNFVLNEFTVRVAAPSPPTSTHGERGGGDGVPVPLQNASADFSQDKYVIADAIDGDPATAWAIAPQFAQRHVAVFETKESIVTAASGKGETPPSTTNSPLTLIFTLDQQYGTEHTIGRLRLSATSEPCPVPAEDLPD